MNTNIVYNFSQILDINQILLVKKTLAIVIAILVSSKEYGLFYPRYHKFYIRNSSSIESFILKYYFQIRILNLICCSLCLFEIAGITSFITMLLTFSFIDFYTSRFSPSIWPNLFHLYTFGIFSLIGNILIKSDLFYTSDFTELIILILQIQVGIIYLFAGISKLIHGGLEWYRDPKPLKLVLLMRGTLIGKYITSNSFMMSSIAKFSLLFELFLPTLLIFPSFHHIFALLAFLFHISIYMTLRISFWHLWIFYPALFLV
tara:strand:+ start:671 stop:1450 length:780 start_codon:yes stop_codon:yes gene_type:complete